MPPVWLLETFSEPPVDDQLAQKPAKSGLALTSSSMVSTTFPSLWTGTVTSTTSPGWSTTSPPFPAPEASMRGA